MDKFRKNGSASGEITVFLTLLLLLLLSFISAAIQSARGCALQNFSEQNLRLGVQSLFAQYCRPLYEEYHLFMLEGGEESSHFVNEILKYQGSISGPFYNTLDREIDIVSTTGFCSDQGKYYQDEILQYMKLHIPQVLLDSEKENFEDLQKAKNTVEVLDKKLETEEELSRLNISVLKIIERVEGAVLKNGKIETAKCFIKQICPGTVSPYETGVDQEEIWNALKSHYLTRNNVSIEKSRDIIALIDETIKDIEKIEAEQEKLNKKMGEYNAFYSANHEELLDGVKKELDMDLGNLKSYQEKETSNISISKQIIQMKEVLLNNQNVLKEYIGAMEERDRKIAERQRRIEEQEKEEREKEKQEKEKQKKDKKNKKKEKKGNKKSVYKGKLYGSVSSTDDIESIEEIQSILKRYQITALHFDYQGFHLKKIENPVEKIKKTFGNKLLALVIKNSDNIKSRKMPVELMIADSAFEPEDNYSSQLSDLSTENSNTVKKGFSAFSGDKILKKGINIADKILESFYFPMHFNNFLKDDSEDEKGFQYEQEYILTGGKTEKESLELFADKLLLTRGIYNFLYLLTDKKRSNEAYLAAAALVGYTGMEPLVQVIKTSLLFGWAMAEATVDLAVLFQGKEVPLWKSDSIFQVEFADLLTFGREQIQRKADEYGSGGLIKGRPYEDYVSFFLMTESQEHKINRSLALIQENLRQHYYDDFSVTEGIYGMNTQAVYEYSGGKRVGVYYNYCY